jgi:hypothetical protein
MYLTREPKGRNARILFNLDRLEFNSNNDRFTHIKDDARLVMANLIFAIFFSDNYEDILSKSPSFSKLNSCRNKIAQLLDTITPQPNISDDSLDDIKDAVNINDSIYWNTIGNLKVYRDKYIQTYDNLDFTKKINSFTQTGEKLKFDTKYLYYDKNERYYKNEGESKTPEKFIKLIAIQLQSNELKEVLNIYKNIKNTDKFSYVVSAMNILYMLCTPRTYLDEETNQTSFFNDELKHIYDY